MATSIHRVYISRNIRQRQSYLCKNKKQSDGGLADKPYDRIECIKKGIKHNISEISNTRIQTFDSIASFLYRSFKGDIANSIYYKFYNIEHTSRADFPYCYGPIKELMED